MSPEASTKDPCACVNSMGTAGHALAQGCRLERVQQALKADEALGPGVGYALLWAVSARRHILRAARTRWCLTQAIMRQPLWAPAVSSCKPGVMQRSCHDYHAQPGRRGDSSQQAGMHAHRRCAVVIVQHAVQHRERPRRHEDARPHLRLHPRCAAGAVDPGRISCVARVLHVLRRHGTTYDAVVVNPVNTVIAVCGDHVPHATSLCDMQGCRPWRPASSSNCSHLECDNGGADAALRTCGVPQAIFAIRRQRPRQVPCLLACGPRGQKPPKVGYAECLQLCWLGDFIKECRACVHGNHMSKAAACKVIHNGHVSVKRGTAQSLCACDAHGILVCTLWTLFTRRIGLCEAQAAPCTQLT